MNSNPSQQCHCKKNARSTGNQMQRNSDRPTYVHDVIKHYQAIIPVVDNRGRDLHTGELKGISTGGLVDYPR